MKTKFLATSLLILGTMSFVSCSNNEGSVNYITNENDFINAIQRGDKTIYVGDFSFNKDTPIIINYPVEIIGKNSKSKIEKALFKLNGTNKEDEQTRISFSNIIFDGLIDKNSYDFETPHQAFSTVFGNNRLDKSLFIGDLGYIDLNLENCDVKRYASYQGPVLKMYNNESYQIGTPKFNINNCSFYENISYSSTILLGHSRGINKITNCTFYNNLAKQAHGLGIANGIIEINNITVKNNGYYNFLNEDAEDDKHHIGGREYNYVSQSGSLYIGGCDGTVSNCLIENNQGLYGGGIGFSTPDSKSENYKGLKFINCNIFNNKADSGGAIYARCGIGNTVKFINCQIFSNTANKGSIIYATSKVPYQNDGVWGGVIDFIFTTIANNKSEEASPQLSFYELRLAKTAGNIKLHGCLGVDDAPYASQSEDYDYFNNKATSINDGVFNENDFDDVLTKGLRPIPQSKGDIDVEASIYSSWDDTFMNKTESRKIGYVKEVHNDESYKIALAIAIPTVVVILAIISLFIIFYYKKKKEIENRNIEEKLATHTYESLLEIVTNNFAKYNLTKKEMEVVAYFLKCNKRKELADLLFVSEDTAKTHISHIFKKMKISSKQDLKKIINSYL